MKVTGIIETVDDVVQINDSFKRRAFTIRYWNFPEVTEFLCFELHNDRVMLLDNKQIKIGDQVIVSFNLKGKKWTNQEGLIKYFVTLQAWNVEKSVGPLVVARS